MHLLLQPSSWLLSGASICGPGAAGSPALCTLCGACTHVGAITRILDMPHGAGARFGRLMAGAAAQSADVYSNAPDLSLWTHEISIGLCRSEPGSPRAAGTQTGAEDGAAAIAEMPWGEQAALLRIEQQACAIDELRATNEVGSSAGGLGADCWQLGALSRVQLLSPNSFRLGCPLSAHVGRARGAMAAAAMLRRSSGSGNAA